ncbi:unnamed protein product, partial [Rotaria sp. Silwood2]
KITVPNSIWLSDLKRTNILVS